MKETWYILIFTLALCSCKHTKPETHVSDIFNNAQYGETHAVSEWAGRHWEIFGNDTTRDFEALTLRISPEGFDSIVTIICNDYGQPTYNHNTLPQELIPDADTGTFWMAWKDHNQFYYWCSDTMNIGFGLFEKELVDGLGSAWLYIERLKKVGPYEAYIDSLRSSNPDDCNIWERCDFFKNERQKRFVNDIYYADSYEVYFGLLNEYLPLAIPSNATEYDRYLASVIQKDSLLAFPGDEAGTMGIYWQANYERSFTLWSIQKFTEMCRNAGFYSGEIDSAWHAYTAAMLTAVDSVVMYRRECQGTISGMEYVAFMGRLEDDCLNSLLDALFFDQRHNEHAAISDEAISAAYKSLKSHLKEHVSKKGFEDLNGCYVPLSERYAALDKDEEAWSAFISARNNLSCSLKGKKKKAFDIATNNLKRSKLWLLKNEYRCYSTSASIGEHDEFYNVLLPFDCSDEELKQYDFKTRYEAEFGEFNMFE